MAVSAQPATVPPGDRLLRLAVDPYTIVAFAALGLLGLAAAGEWQPVPWVAVVGAVAGWSSAWSP